MTHDTKTSSVIKFAPPEPVDFSYIMDDAGEIIGVSGRNCEMEILDHGFLFDGLFVTRDELIAFILISGVWEDVQDKEYFK